LHFGTGSFGFGLDLTVQIAAARVVTAAIENPDFLRARSQAKIDHLCHQIQVGIGGIFRRPVLTDIRFDSHNVPPSI